MLELKVIEALEAEAAAFSHEALSAPRGQDTYAYGCAVGYYTGLLHARTVVQGLLDDEKERDRER